MNQKSVIELKNKLINSNQVGIALDIDETIADTFIYWVQKAIDEFGNPTNLTPRQIFEKYKILQNVDFWEKEKILSFCSNALNSEEFHSGPLPINGVLDEIDKLHKNHNVVAYITARQHMFEETTSLWLKKHGFPDAPVIVREKGVDISEINIWKARVLEYLYPQVFGIVDDNPTLAKEISNSYKGKIFILSFESHEYEKHNAIACKDWKKVHFEIKNFKNEVISK